MDENFCSVKGHYNGFHTLLVTFHFSQILSAVAYKIIFWSCNYIIIFQAYPIIVEFVWFSYYGDCRMIFIKTFLRNVFFLVIQYSYFKLSFFKFQIIEGKKMNWFMKFKKRCDKPAIALHKAAGMVRGVNDKDLQSHLSKAKLL